MLSVMYIFPSLVYSWYERHEVRKTTAVPAAMRRDDRNCRERYARAGKLSRNPTGAALDSVEIVSYETALMVGGRFEMRPRWPAKPTTEGKPSAVGNAGRKPAVIRSSSNSFTRHARSIERNLDVVVLSDRIAILDFARTAAR
jgi:hypothetical protein